MHNMLHLQRFPQKTQAGFTLVEALIAMLILVVAIVGWMGAQDASVSNRGLSRTMTVATELVQSKIEELAEDPGEFCGSPPCNNQQESIVVDGFEYTLTWDMDRQELIVSGSNVDGPLQYARLLWTITVEGSWEYRGTKTRELTRIVADKE